MTAISLRRVVVTLMLSAAATAVACLAVATPSWAHAELVHASPGNGQTLQYPPERLRLQFTEPVSLAGDGVRLFTSTGSIVHIGAPVHPANDQTTVDVPLPEALAHGGYAVAWRVVSADGHPVSGALTFNIGVPGAAAPVTVPAPPPDSGATAYGITRWFGFAALALLVGTAFFLVYAWPGGARKPMARRLLWSGWAASVAAVVASGLMYGPYLTGASLSRTLDGQLIAETANTRLGTALGVRLALLLMLGPVIWYGLRWLAQARALNPRTSVVLSVAVLVTGAVLAITWGAAGHSATGTLSGAALVSDVVHLTGMAVWLGGLVVLALALLPTRDVASMRAAVPRFSSAAAASVAALIATGVFQAWRQVRTMPALLTTPYGRLLLLKVAAVLVILALAAAARASVKKHYADRHSGPDPHQLYYFRRGITREVLLALAVLGISAALVNSEPAHSAYAAARVGPPTPAAQTGTPVPPGLVAFDAGGPAGRGLLAFEVQPRRVGATGVHVSVLDRDSRPMAVPDVKVTLSLPDKDLGPIPVPVQAAGDGHFFGTATFPIAGKWEAAVTIRVSEVDQTTLRLPLEFS